MFATGSLLVLLLDYTRCFNIEDREPIVKWSQVPGSYFGFSVAQHETSDGKKWMLVGAPLGQNLQPGTNRSGALFKCPLTDDRYDCVQVETDGRRDQYSNFDYELDPSEANEKLALKSPNSDEIKNEQWLGVTVKSQKNGGCVVVCAHRYIQSDNLDLYHYGLGLCYVLNKDLAFDDVLEPCKGKPMRGLHLEYAFCQVGTSLALLENGMAVMGAPGPLAWRGTIFVKEVGGEYLTRKKMMYQGTLDNGNVTDKYSYLGMSSEGGRFFDKEQLSYVSGAPRSENKGEVIFFDLVPLKDILKVRLRLKGEQFASGFGYEILAVDIDNDGYDDLLVGAPFYYEENKVGGAVYIYYNLRHCTLDPCEKSVLKGKTESRFGFAMAALGDINKDGYKDVAIGAPYEGAGVIYIYLGTSNGLQNKPSQVIKSKGFRALGYSLSAGLDMDNNKYPDLVAGAYESGVAIIYKTRPIIDIEIKISGDIKNINTTNKGCADDPTNRNNTCFSFKCCFSIREQLKQRFYVTYHIEEVLDNAMRSRIWFHDRKFPNKHNHYKNMSRIAVDRTNQDICQHETVYINEGVRDILTPIVFNVKYAVENNIPNSPMLNKTATQRFEATFQKDCGGDDICESHLTVSASCFGNYPMIDGKYLLNMGENEELQIEVNVTNSGDAAYEAKLFFSYPESLSYISLLSDKEKHDSTDCSLMNSSMVNCSLGNPFNAGKSSSIRLRFEVLKNAERILNFFVFVNSTSKELSHRTSQGFGAILEKVAEFQLVGKSLTTHVFFGGEIKGESSMKNFEDIGERVKHRYQISNNGQWTLQNVTINISWPFQVQSNRVQGKWLLYLERTPEVEDGYCYVDPPSAVNPKKLNSSGLTVEEMDNSTALNFTEYYENFRIKRETLFDAVPEKLIDVRGNNVVKLDCISGTAKCVNIVCHFRKLGKDDPKIIDISSRVWNSTLTEDYTNVDWVSIVSNARIHVDDNTISIDEASQKFDQVETVAYPMVVPPESHISFWIILISIGLGLLLLILLLYFLYKLGFFKRNRVDRTLSGNLKKNGESESLIQINDEKLTK